MGYWRIVTNDSETEPGVSAYRVQMTRLDDRFYGIKENAPNAKKLMAGDKVIFYIAGKNGGYFSADATLKTGLVELSPEESKRLCHSGAFQATHGVYLEDEVNIWPKKVFLSKAINDIPSFGKYRNNPGNAVRGTIRGLSQEEYQALVRLGIS